MDGRVDHERGCVEQSSAFLDHTMMVYEKKVLWLDQTKCLALLGFVENMSEFGIPRPVRV